MYLAVLRVSSESDVAIDLLSRYGLAVERSWKAGETDVLGRTSGNAGFNVVIGEEETSLQLLNSIDRWWAAHGAFLTDIATPGVSVTLDVGISVDMDHPNRTLGLGADLLGRLADAGLSLELTTYLASPADVPSLAET